MASVTCNQSEDPAVIINCAQLSDNFIIGSKAIEFNIQVVDLQHCDMLCKLFPQCKVERWAFHTLQVERDDWLNMLVSLLALVLVSSIQGESTVGFVSLMRSTINWSCPERVFENTLHTKSIYLCLLSSSSLYEVVNFKSRQFHCCLYML